MTTIQRKVKGLSRSQLFWLELFVDLLMLAEAVGEQARSLGAEFFARVRRKKI